MPRSMVNGQRLLGGGRRRNVQKFNRDKQGDLGEQQTLKLSRGVRALFLIGRIVSSGLTACSTHSQCEVGNGTP